MTVPELPQAPSTWPARASQRPRLAIGPVAALLLSVAILTLANGLQNTVLAIRGGAEGFGETAIGLMMSAYFFGFAAGSFFWPNLIDRVGHVRAFAVFASVASAAALAHLPFLSPLGWTILRFGSGACYAGLIVVAESWLNLHALHILRGRLLAIYGLVGMGAMAAGQLLLIAVDSAGVAPFLLVSALLSIAVTPVALGRSPVPEAVATDPADARRIARVCIGELYRISPLAFVGSCLVGLAMSAFWGLGPTFAQTLSFETRQISLFMASPMIGALTLQWPLGWFADRHDRRRAIALACLLTAAASFAIAAATERSAIGLVPLAFLFGGFGLPIYSLCVAHANDLTSTARAVSVAGGLLGLYGLGASIGPFVASLLMDLIGPQGLFLYTGALLLVLLGFALHRPNRASPPMTEASIAPLTPAELDGDQGRPCRSVFD